MKYAIFSDVHGNLHALKSVLADIETQKVDRIVCLGDLVGYGAFPNQVTDMVRDSCAVIIAGNHDHAAVGMTDIYFFNEFAYRAVLWTREKLTKKNVQWLTELPLSIVENELQFVHASPMLPESWFYIFSKDDAQAAMQAARAGTVFVGHTHVPFDYMTRNGRIINVGSAGQPRDGDPRAAWTLYNTATGERRLMRVEYDIYAARDAIHLEGLPPFLAKRLLAGR